MVRARQRKPDGSGGVLGAAGRGWWVPRASRPGRAAPRARSPRSRSFPRVRAAWCLLLASLLTSAACGPGGGASDGATRAASDAPPRARITVLALFDGLAAEHVGTAAARLPWPAELDPTKGAAWQHRLPPSTSAVATLATWLTGLLPAEHGLLSVRDAGAERLAPRVPTVAEALSARGGKAQAALAAAPFGDALCGLGRGFELWDAPAIGQQRGAHELVVRLLDSSAAARASGDELLLVVAFQRDPDPPAKALVPHLLARLEGTLAQVEWGNRLAAPGGGTQAAAEFAETFARRRSSPEADALEAARRDAAVSAQVAALGTLLDGLGVPPARLLVSAFPAPGWPALAGQAFDAEAWTVPHLAWGDGVAAGEITAAHLALALVPERPSAPTLERTVGTTVGLLWERAGPGSYTHRLLPGGLVWRGETFGTEEVPEPPPAFDALCIESAPDAPSVHWLLIGPSGDLAGLPAGAPRPLRIDPGAKVLVPLLRRGAALDLVRPEDCAAPVWLGGSLAPAQGPARQALDLGPFGGHFDGLFGAAAPPPPGALRITRIGPRPGRLEEGPLGAAGADERTAARRYLGSLPAGM